MNLFHEVQKIIPLTLMTKKTSLALTFPLLILPCVADLFPNGDFENAGISWEEVSGSGTYGFSYPDMDGHPNGFGVIDHSAADGGFGIWVGNDGQLSHRNPSRSQRIQSGSTLGRRFLGRI